LNYLKKESNKSGEVRPVHTFSQVVLVLMWGLIVKNKKD